MTEWVVYLHVHQGQGDGAVAQKGRKSLNSFLKEANSKLFWHPLLLIQENRGNSAWIRYCGVRILWSVGASRLAHSCRSLFKSISTPPRPDASPLQVTPPNLLGFHNNSPLPIYHLGGERHCESKVKCRAQEHITVSPARTRAKTARSGVERTNHEATTPPWTIEITL